MVFRVTAAAADFLERLALELDVPASRYEEAESRYHSVGDWLGREESSLKEHSPDVYVQGSFRLGTPIRPVNDEEHYDIDLVCELSLGKHEVSQKDLKAKLGLEMKLYAERYGMKPASEGRRCWTLDYADGAQFHLDALPAIPDGEGRRIALESLHLSAEWSRSSIAITDTECDTYEVRSTEWPHSNPRGFTEWFRSRMKIAFNEQRRQLALEAHANVEDVPAYRVKTPLQQVVQILKRHRDIRFSHKAEVKPISVIITTLAAKAYANQADLPEALASILENMHSHIEQRDGVYWIENPTDPAENFADRWRSHPERKDAFFEWLHLAREDFESIAGKENLELVMESAGVALGESFARKVRADTSQAKSMGGALSLFQRAASVFSAAHRQAPPWAGRPQGKVRIARARTFQNGFRPEVLLHDAAPLRKGVALEFAATTDVPKPYSVYWQIVNTGQEAKFLNKLRGDFNFGVIVKGEIVHKEDAAYSGAHSVECFIVKDGSLAARSGAFVVNVD
jgi:Adenylyl/Guanylyl and SMODS C-terminal sensor domain